MKTKPDILIVEDDGVLALHLQDLLTRQGYNVLKPLPSGEKALKSLTRVKPDLILMDIELAGKMNGITAAEYIGEKYDLPVIYLTGFSQDALLQQAKIAAPYGYLVKPVPERELAATIEMALYKHKIDHQIKASEAKYRSLIEQAMDGVILFDENGSFLGVNDTFCQMLEYTHDELMILNIHNVIAPENIEAVPLRYPKMRVGEIINLERVLVRKDGSRFPVEIRGKKLAENRQQVIVRDITERKLAEQQLVKINERYLLASHAANLGIWDWDIVQNKQVWDENMYRLYGNRQDYFEGTHESWLKFLHPDDIALTKKISEQARRGECEYDTEYRVIWPDGSIHWLKAYGRVTRADDGTPLRMTGVNYDITELKENEHKEKRNQSRLQSMLEITQYKAKDLQDLLDFSLEKAIQLTESKIGYIYFYDEGKKEFTLNSWSADVLDECKVMDRQTKYQLEKTGFWGEAVRQRHAIVNNNFEADNPHKKGAPAGHVALKKFMTIPVFINNQIVAVVGVANKPTDYDATDELQLTLMMDSVWKMVEQARADEKLRQESAALNAAANAIVITNLQGEIEWANPAFTKLTGFSLREAAGKNPRDLIKSDRHPREFYQQMWETVLAGEVWKGELTNKRKDGSLYDEEMIITPLRNAQGEIYQFIAIKQDITERRQAEEESRRNENFLRSIFNAIPTPVFYNDSDGRYQRINPALSTMLGLPEEKILGKTSADLPPKDHAKEYFKRDREILRSGVVQRFETEVYDNIGQPHPVIYHKAPYINPNDEVEGFISVLMDISEQKNTEEQLRRQTDGMTRLLEYSQDFMTLNADQVDFQEITNHLLNISGGLFVAFNQFEENSSDFHTIAVAGKGIPENKATQILGFKLAGKKWKHDAIRLDRIKDNLITRFSSLQELTGRVIPRAIMQSVQKTYNPGETVIVRIMVGEKNIGDFTIIMPAGIPFEAEKLVTIYSRQVGLLLQRTQAEDSLRTSEEKYRLLVDHSSDLIWNLGMDGIFTYLSPSWSRVTGYQPTELISKSFTTIVHPDDLPATLAYLTQMQHTSQPQLTPEYRVKHTDGAWHWHSGTTSPVLGEKGKVVSIVGVSRDITQRKQVEEELRKSEEQFRKLSEDIPVCINNFKIDGTILYSNNANAALSGHTTETLFGKNFYDLLDEQDKQTVKSGLDSLTPSHPTESHDQIHNLPDGSTHFLEWRNRAFFDDAGNVTHCLAVGIDYTERIKAEEQRRQLEEKFTKAFHTSPDAIAINRASDGLYMDINEGFTALTGYSQVDILGKTSLEISIWPDAEVRSRVVGKLMEEGEVNNLEIPFRIKNGKKKFGLFSAKILDIAGERCILSITHDISDRKQMEETLRYSEERYRLLFDEMAEGFALHEIIVDSDNQPVDYRFLDTNPAFEKQTGLVGKDIIGRTVKEVMPLTEDYWIQSYGKVALTGEILHYENYSEPLGKWFSVTAFCPKFGQFATTIEDITSRKKADLALAESEEQFRSTFEQASIGMTIISTDGNFVRTNPAFAQMLGYTREELVGLAFTSITHPDDVDLSVGKKNQFLTEYTENINFEKRYIHKDGHTLWVLVNSSLILDSLGQPRHFITQVQDITDRKQAETKIQDQLDELRRWNAVTLGREKRIITLKQEVNKLREQIGQPPLYSSGPTREQADE